MVAARKNIELKARCADLIAAQAAALQVGAVPAAVLHQIDTYFIVPNGRLKLREINGERAELIQYHRSDRAEFRGSSYHVVPVSDPGLMKTALTAALGCRGEVRKRRELLMYHNVRIHLDEVANLGSFLEFEAVVSPDVSEAICLERLATLRAALSIRDDQQIAVSYSDLLGL